MPDPDTPPPLGFGRVINTCVLMIALIAVLALILRLFHH